VVVATNREFELSGSSLTDALSQHAAARPDATAVTEIQALSAPVETSYTELDSLARRFAASFEREVPHGTNVLFLLSRSAHCVAAIFGAMSSGHTFACLSDKLRARQIARVIAESNPAYVIVDSAGLMALRSGLDGTDGLASAKWFLIRDARYAAIHERTRKKLARLVELREWRLAEETTAAAGSSYKHIDASSHAGCILFTSGSTGRQRGVRISTSNLNACAAAEAELYGLTADDSLLSILPFAFDVGLMQLLSGIRVGAAITLLNSWMPQDLLDVCEQQAITGISAVPSIWAEFLSGNRAFATSGAHRALRYITISGGDLSPEQLANIETIAPAVNVFKTYGQSETFRSAALKPEEFIARPESVGRAFGNARFYIVRDDRSLAPVGEVGEIVHTGLGTMLGYTGTADDTKLQPNPFRIENDTAEYAVFTGDLGWVDEQGYLYLQGRRDDLVKVNGNRVHLVEVRNELCRIDKVGSAEIVAIPDEKTRRLVAFVVPRSGNQISPLELKSVLSKMLPSYMVPDHVVVRERIPKTANGKPRRNALIAEAKALFANSRDVSSEAG
jgi:acyl-CoA synthetase (AMP-forming)/AMP-acid ligase II